MKVGTRGSKLALTQTQSVIRALQALDDALEIDQVVIKTTGDKIQDQALFKIGSKGLFVKEIEAALLAGEIDLAVHSMKDMPTEEVEGLSLVPLMKREDARDFLVSRHPIEDIRQLPSGAKIGTGSLRRGQQLKVYCESVELVPIRGNVDTRIRKIKEENLDGVILAAAGLRRLGYYGQEGARPQQDLPLYFIPIDTGMMVPAPAQGILACQYRTRDEEMAKRLNPLMDPVTCYASTFERYFLQSVGGGCHFPLGAYLEVSETGTRLLTYLGGDNQGIYETLALPKVGPIYEESLQQISHLAKRMKSNIEA